MATNRGNDVTLFRNAIIFTTLQFVLLLTCSDAGFTQGNALDPEQLKKSLAGMTKEQIKQKYMSMAFPNRHVSDKWPTNFPLPKYANNVLSTQFSNSTKGRPSAQATLTTKDSPQVVFSFYKDACERGGWAVRTPSAKAMANSKHVGQFFMLEGKKDNQEIELTCLPSSKNSATILSIMWYKLR
jgi:hypothetical protein